MGISVTGEDMLSGGFEITGQGQKRDIAFATAVEKLRVILARGARYLLRLVGMRHIPFEFLGHIAVVVGYLYVMDPGFQS